MHAAVLAVVRYAHSGGVAHLVRKEVSVTVSVRKMRLGRTSSANVIPQATAARAATVESRIFRRRRHNSVITVSAATASNDSTGKVEVHVLVHLLGLHLLYG